MRNNLVVDGVNFQGHMDAAGAYADIAGTLTASAPTVTTTMDGTVFVNVQIYLTPLGTSHYVTAYIDNVYAGYCSCYSSLYGTWCTLSFPMRQGQVLKLTATGLTGSQVFYYVIHKMYYKAD